MLGVEKGASQDEIKSAYFRKAKMYHPDISKEFNAKEKFSKITEAYETLSDETKRRSYDFNKRSSQFREAYENRHNQDNSDSANYSDFMGGHGNRTYTGPKDNFGEFFKDFDDFLNFRKMRKGGNKTGPGRESKAHKGKNVVLNVSLDFLEAINGTKKTVVYHKHAKCVPCDGTGKESTRRYCEECDGRGYFDIRHGKGYKQVPCK